MPAPFDRTETMKYTLAAFFNAMTLAVGILLGFALSSRLDTTASAQQSHAASAAPQTSSQACTSSATVECVAPIMTVGSAAIPTLLSSRIATDQLAVNGFDILKLENNILNSMIAHHVITTADAQQIIDNSHPDKFLRFQPPTPAPSTPPKK